MQAVLGVVKAPTQPNTMRQGGKTMIETIQNNGVKGAKFKDVNAVMQAPPLALTRGLHDLALDNPFLQVTDPAAVRQGAGDIDQDWLSTDGEDSKTLDDYLLEQIHLEFKDVPLRRVLINLVSYLESDGYLRTPLGLIETELDASHQMVEDALAILQTLNPAGVGARDLRECLLLQIDAEEDEWPLVRRMVSRGLNLVAENDIAGLVQEFSASAEEVVNAIAYIKRLSPAPASYYNQPRPQVAVPELEIDLSSGKPVAKVLKSACVKIRFDEDYYGELVKRRDGALRRFLAQQRRDYDWLEFNLKKRYEILEAVGQVIAERQEDFFRFGGELKPLLVREAVSATHLTAGAVNRAINGHYLTFNGQNYELRHFFSYRHQ